MSEHQASRTLVKSPPELWAECSDAGSLARHLGGSLGEIKITRLEPETTVAWEGEQVSGTVRLETAGWGTRVTLTVAGAAAQPSEPPEPPDRSALADGPEPPTQESARTRFATRMRRWFRPEPVVPEPIEAPAAPPAPEPQAPDPEPDPIDLSAVLDSLGKAHHRPYSRA